jgi:hypothetical protein
MACSLPSGSRLAIGSTDFRRRSPVHREPCGRAVTAWTLGRPLPTARSERSPRGAGETPCTCTGVWRRRRDRRTVRASGRLVSAHSDSRARAAPAPIRRKWRDARGSIRTVASRAAMPSLDYPGEFWQRGETLLPTGRIAVRWMVIPCGASRHRRLILRMFAGYGWHSRWLPWLLCRR